MDRMREVLALGSSAEALRELSRLYEDEDGMSSRAYRELRDALERSSIDATRLASIEERLKRLEQGITMPDANSLPQISVDDRFKNLEFVRLLQLGAGSNDWNKVILGSLWPASSATKDGRVRVDDLLTVWVQRLRFAKKEGVELGALSDSLWDTVLQQPESMDRQRLVSALTFAVENCPEGSLAEFLERFFKTCVDGRQNDRGLVTILTTVLRREALSLQTYDLKNKTMRATRERMARDKEAVTIFLQSLSGALASSKSSSESILEEVNRRLDLKNPASMSYGLLLLDTVLQGEHQFKSKDALEDADIAQKLARIENSEEPTEFASEAKRLFDVIRARLGWIGNLTSVEKVTEDREFSDWPAAGTDNREIWLALEDVKTNEYTVLGMEIKGGVEVTIVDREAMRVLDRFRLLSKQRREITNSAAGFLRLRSSKSVDARLKIEIRERPTELQLAASFADAAEIEIGQIYRGDFTKSTGGWIKFRGTRGTYYVIQTQRLTSAADTVLRLSRGESPEVAQHDDTDQDRSSRIDWLCVDNTVFGLQVTGYGSSAGRFDLEVRAAETIRISAPVVASTDADAAATLAISDSAIPVIIPEDSPFGWIRVSLEEDRVYQIRSDSHVDVLETPDVELTQLKLAETGTEQSGVLRDVMYVITMKKGPHWIKLRRSRPGIARALIEIQHSEEMAQFEVVHLTGVPKGAPAVSLPLKPQSPGYLCRTSSLDSYLAFQAEAGVTYRFAAIPMYVADPVTIGIVRIGDDEKIEEMEGVEKKPNSLSWKSTESGQCYLQLRTKGNPTILLNSAKYEVHTK